MFTCVYVYATNIPKEKDAMHSVWGGYAKHSRESRWEDIEMTRRNDTILLKLKTHKNLQC